MKSNSTKKQIVYVLCSVFLILSPWVLLFITILFAGGSISDSHPLWSDELAYWHEVLSLSEKGLNFGYYSINEQIPQYLSFGSHGFGTISAYLPYAKLFGWNYNSLVLANTLYISVAFILLVVLTKPPIKKMLLIAAFYLTYMPLILYSFTSMSELLNYASLLTYFVLLYIYMKAEQRKNLLFTILLLFAVYISFIRIIYIVLFIPILLEKAKISGINKKFWIVMAIWIVLSGAIYYVNSLFVAPYPFSFLAELFSYSSVSEFLYELQKHFFRSIGKFFSFKNDTVLQIIQRYFVFLIFIVFLFKSDIIRTKFKKWNFPFFSSFFILFLILVINFAVYDIFDWRDYRVIAPILFGIILFATLTEKSNLIIKCATGINLAILFVFVFILPSSYHSEVFAKERYRTIEPINDLKAIEYEPNARSKFDNTVILNGFIFSGFDVDITLNIPAGIGISTCFEEISDNIQSRYIYSSEEHTLKTYKIIRSSPKGFLYRKIQD